MWPTQLLTSLSSSFFGTLLPRSIPIMVFGVNKSLEAGSSPLLIIAVWVVWATLGTATLRTFDQQIHTLLERHKQATQHRKSPIKFPSFKIPHLKNLSDKISHKLHEQVHLTENPYLIGLIIALLTSSVVHDIIVVEIGRKKMSFVPFIISTFGGKILLFVTLVYGRQWLLAIRGI